MEKIFNRLVTERGCSNDCSTSHKQVDSKGKVINFVGSCKKDYCNSAPAAMTFYWTKLLVIFSAIAQFWIKRN